MTRMDQVFKAYDVRGTVPDQLDAHDVPGHRPGHGPVRRGARDPDGPRHARIGGGAVGGLLRRRALRGGRGHRPRDGVHRLPLLRRRASRCPGRHVHRLAQPGAVQRHEAVPLRRPPHRPRHRAGRDPGDRRVPAGRASGPGRGPPARAQPARRMGGARDLLRRPGLPATAQGRRRHRQRHGGLGRAHRLLQPPVLGGDPLPRARRQLPQPPGRPDPAGEPE